MIVIILQNVCLPFTAPEEEALKNARFRLRIGGICDADIAGLSVYRRSVDARKKNDIKFNYSIAVTLALPEGSLDCDRMKRLGAVTAADGEIKPLFGDEGLTARPVIIGFGPAGMFAGMLLADYGYRPLIIERGSEVSARAEKVARFYSERILDVNTNIQFGAGGAGTFSDGKLLTRVTDAKCRFVLQRLCDLGAPREILLEQKPHIGTDKLRTVVGGADKYIRERGGEIIYDCLFDAVKEKSGRVVSISTSLGEFECGAVILAVGHSARDTYAKLRESGFDLAPKPFSVGVRVEHLQADIDAAMFGLHAGDKRLGHAEYALSTKFGGVGVYTFCMCPGGEVAAAASEEGGIVTNGMSGFARDGKNANSAVAVSVDPSAMGADPIEYQRQIERAAFIAGGSNYNAPVSTLGDFMTDKLSHEPKRVLPTYMGGGKYKLARMDGVFDANITSALRFAFRDFGRYIKGFDAPDAILTAPETRTSSPIRIQRGESLTSDLYENVYPCGEGAGYAGGITSAALDGLNCALAIIARYRA